jgi:putative nucleotidyltransferase with HDIG domain
MAKPKFKTIEGFEDNSHIRIKINKVSNLSPLPMVVRKVMEISNDPNSTATSLGSVIKKDQSLTAKILKIVNSAYFGFYRKISNIDQAIVILGFEEIKNITIATSLMQSFPTDYNFVLNRDDFWMHSLSCAFISKALCSSSLELNAEDAFVVGLIHDIGKLVLLQHLNQPYNLVIYNSAEHIEKLHKVEKAMIGVSHAEVGGILAENWKLPRQLVDAISNHHDPEKAGPDALYTHIAHIANYFSHKYQLGMSYNPKPDDVSKMSLKALGLDKIYLEDLWKKIKIDEKFLRGIL